jgi:hypothetical protein
MSNINNSILTDLPTEITNYMSEFFTDFSYRAVIQTSHAVYSQFVDNRRVLAVQSALSEIIALVDSENTRNHVLGAELMGRLLAEPKFRYFDSNWLFTPDTPADFILVDDNLLSIVDCPRLLRILWWGFPAIRNGFTDRVMCEIARTNFDSLKFLHSRGVPITLQVVEALALVGNLEHFEWILQNQFPISECVVGSAARRGYLPLLKRLYKHRRHRKFFTTAAFHLAIHGGNVKTIQWFWGHEESLSTISYRTLLSCASVDLYKLICENASGLDLGLNDSWVTTALVDENIPLVEYFLTKGAGLRYDVEKATYDATLFRRLDALKWIAARGDKFNHNCMSAAIRSDSTKMFNFVLSQVTQIQHDDIMQVHALQKPKWMLQIYNNLYNGERRAELALQYFEDFTNLFIAGYAASGGLTVACGKFDRVDLLSKLIEDGYPWDEDFVASGPKDNALIWAVEHRCPRYQEAAAEVDRITRSWSGLEY